MRRNQIVCAAAALVLLLCLNGCAGHRARLSPLGTPCSIAGAKLKQEWRSLQETIESGGCAQQNGQLCDALRARIERLSVDCPSNSDVVMANALLAYEAHDAVRSQQLLDELFQLGARNPEAGVLRARIAIEQGNLPFALRFLEQQIRQSADHAGLRETLASALYLAGKPEESRTQLMAAKTLGAPVWRVAYGLGLIEESASRFEDARQRYEECLQAKPGWKPAESRLRGLLVAGKVKQ